MTRASLTTRKFPISSWQACLPPLYYSMDLTTTAYGTWNGGKFMHFGEALDDQRFESCIRLAYESGIRTFITADVYGAGRADSALGEALSGFDRATYCLVGMIGHDFYNGTRQGSAGYPRFTDPKLRSPRNYRTFVVEAAEKSLERCKSNYFDLLMLHNPDERGYTREEVWDAFTTAKDAGLCERIGIAPGPANGFTLDLAHCFDHFGSILDWAMIILNPNEPWPGQLVLPAAEANDIDVLTRVVDYGGIFWDDVRPGHPFKPGDHRTYRPDGWIEHGHQRLEQMRPVAEKYNITTLQLACLWNLSQNPVKCVVPTLIQEHGNHTRPIEEKIHELAALPTDIRLTNDEVELLRTIGDNTNCMLLKGASQRHETSTRPDEWPMREDLLETAENYQLGNTW